jgi:hypothetical protein
VLICCYSMYIFCSLLGATKGSKAVSKLNETQNIFIKEKEKHTLTLEEFN